MHSHDGGGPPAQEGRDGMGHVGGWRGAATMALCCLPMIAVIALAAYGVLR